MMRVVCYLEDNFGVVCKPVSFPLLKNSLEMFFWNSKDQEKDPEVDFIKVEVLNMYISKVLKLYKFKTTRAF